LGSFNQAEALCRKNDVEGLLLACRNGDIPDFIDNIKAFCREQNMFMKSFSIDIVDIN